MHVLIRVIAVGLVGISAGSIAWAAPIYIARDLGSLGADPQGVRRAFATDINNAGRVTGYSSVYDVSGSSKGQAAFLYSGGQLINLGTLGTNASGAGNSFALAMNNAGQVTGGSTVFNSNHRPVGSAAFLYSGGSLTNLGRFGTDSQGRGSSNGVGINNSGQVIGDSNVYDSSGAFRGIAAFLYSGGQLINLGNFGTDLNLGFTYSSATSINNAGQVTGSSGVWDASGNNKGQAAFLYKDGSLKQLGNFGTDAQGRGYSFGNAINDAGQIAGGSVVIDSSGNSKGTAPFIYKDGALIQLGDVGMGTAINNAGAVIGVSEVYDSSGTPKGDTAFLYRDNRLIELGNFGTDASGYGYSYTPAFGEGINAKGTVVGKASYWNGRSLEDHAAVSFGSAFLDLNELSTGLGVFTLNEAVAVNDRGQIAANGCDRLSTGDPNPNHCHAFLLTPNLSVPEPSSLALLSLALVSFAIVRRAATCHQS